MRKTLEPRTREVFYLHSATLSLFENKLFRSTPISFYRWLAIFIRCNCSHFCISNIGDRAPWYTLIPQFYPSRSEVALPFPVSRDRVFLYMILVPSQILCSACPIEHLLVSEMRCPR